MEDGADTDNEQRPHGSIGQKVPLPTVIQRWGSEQVLSR
jgi:hypothetical protein